MILKPILFKIMAHNYFKLQIFKLESTSLLKLYYSKNMNLKFLQIRELIISDCFDKTLVLLENNLLNLWNFKSKLFIFHSTTNFCSIISIDEVL